MQPSCGIKEYKIEAFRLRICHCLLCYVYRAFLIAECKYLHTDLLSVYLQLFDCRRSIYVAGRQQRLASFGLELRCELCSRCRLSGSLKTRHQYNGHFRGRAECNLRRLGTHQRNELLVYNLDHHLTRIQTVHNICSDGLFLNSLYELLYHLEADVCLEKCHLDFLQCSLYVRLRQATLTTQIFKYILKLF